MNQSSALPTPSHRLTLEQRKLLTLTGVTEVVRFDDSSVHLRTAQGELLITGSQLTLKALTPQGGQVVVEGEITALQYAKKPDRGGFWSRLLG